MPTWAELTAAARAAGAAEGAAAREPCERPGGESSPDDSGARRAGIRRRLQGWGEPTRADWHRTHKRGADTLGALILRLNAWMADSRSRNLLSGTGRMGA
mmetsp:Transcript_65547/g.116119  ORF Transcript_65547/g.116119 Transcript_65547/m.116119 type:complete len:100 (+) Transcript_65547:167-466(+)